MTRSDSSSGGALVTARTPTEVVKARIDALPAEERDSIESAIAQMVVAEQLSATIPKAVVWGAAFLARDLKLRFELGHVIVYPSRSKGRETFTYYLTQDGWITWAGRFRDRNGDPLYAGLELETIVGEEKASLAIPDHLLARRARAYRHDFKVPAEGIGYADPNISPKVHPVEAAHPLMMAESRAIRRAMRRAFPLSDLPDDAAHIQASLPVIEERPSDLIDLTATALPTDDWQQFWIQARALGFENPQVYDIIERHSGQSLVIPDAKGAVGAETVVKSMKAFDGTPIEALGILQGMAIAAVQKVAEQGGVWEHEVDDPGGIGQGIAPTPGGQDPMTAELFGPEEAAAQATFDDEPTEHSTFLGGSEAARRYQADLAAAEDAQTGRK